MTGESNELRPSWDDTWMEIAFIVAKRSTCLRRQVGAVIVSADNEVVSSGYNGAPRGQKHCLVRGCEREELNVPSGERYELCRAVHAEENAMMQAGLAKLRGATMYTTFFPCNLCGKKIANTGIARVVYAEGENLEKYGLGVMSDANIPLHKYRRKNDGQVN